MHELWYLQGATATLVITTPVSPSHTNICMDSNARARKSQTAVRVTGLSITEDTQNLTCFRSPQSGAFECRGGTKIFGKSVDPCPSLYSHTTEHIFITLLHTGILRFSAQIKHFFSEIWFSKTWRSNSGSAEHSSRLDVSFTNGHRRFKRH